jgi:hypothetical protein
MRMVFKSAAFLLVVLVFSGCATSSSVVQNPSPVLTSRPVSCDRIQVQASSSLAGLEPEVKVLNDLIVSGLKETYLFSVMGGDQAVTNTGDGIKIVATIREIKQVSSNTREWVGALVGEARVLVHVTISDLKSGRAIESSEVEGRSGKSAFGGTTPEAMQRVADAIVSEVVKLNAQLANDSLLK